MNSSGNQVLVGAGYLTENNFECLGYFFVIGFFVKNYIFQQNNGLYIETHNKSRLLCVQLGKHR